MCGVPRARHLSAMCVEELEECAKQPDVSELTQTEASSSVTSGISDRDEELEVVALSEPREVVVLSEPRARRDYLGRRIPKYHDTTRLHAAFHYSRQSGALFRDQTQRFGNGVDLASRGVMAGSNVALSAQNRTPGVGMYATHRDARGRHNTIAGRAASMWH